MPTGIITRGLGGDATSMLLGKFNLGFTSIKIEILRGGGGLKKPTIEGIRITVVYKNKTWIETYEYKYFNQVMMLVIDTKQSIKEFIIKITAKLK